MSLLPSLFRQTDIPVQLGAKVERPAPKKPDPIKEFETGMHDPDGTVWRHIGVDHARPWQRTAAAALAKLAVSAERTDLMQDFKTLIGVYASRGLDFNPFEIRKAVGIPIDARPTNEQLSQMIDRMLDVIEAHDKEPPVQVTLHAPSWDNEPPQSPAQDAKAKKMAEIQKAKQELRSMVKKSY